MHGARCLPTQSHSTTAAFLKIIRPTRHDDMQCRIGMDNDNPRFDGPQRLRRFYSARRLLTGFAIPARTAWNPTVSTATPTASTAANPNTHHPMLTRNT